MPRRAGLTEPVILDAAAELADETGLDGVSLAAVARRLGVRAPSLYNHVDGLAGLRHGLAALGSEEMARRLTRAAVGKSGEDAALGIARAYRAYAEERPGLYGATLRAPEGDETRRIAASEETLEIIGLALESYALAGDDLIHAIRGLRSVIHGFVSLERSGSFGMTQDVDDSFEYVIRAYLHGLAREPEAPSGRRT
jgi:AcrR family transcriptional regulator